MIALRILIFAIVVSSAISIRADNNYPQKFENLSIENGLSHNNVYCAIQDNNGFLWFGTASGINRYDGYNFQKFRFDPNNINSLSSNYIRCLFQDSNGNIWVGTDNGLNRFNTTTGIFTSFFNDPDDSKSLSNNHIRALLEDKTGIFGLAQREAV